MILQPNIILYNSAAARRRGQRRAAADLVIQNLLYNENIV